MVQVVYLFAFKLQAFCCNLVEFAPRCQHCSVHIFVSSNKKKRSSRVVIWLLNKLDQSVNKNFFASVKKRVKTCSLDRRESPPQPVFLNINKYFCCFYLRYFLITFIKMREGSLQRIQSKLQIHSCFQTAPSSPLNIPSVAYIVSCRGILHLGCPVSRYYRVVPPRWGLVRSVLFTIVPCRME